MNQKRFWQGLLLTGAVAVWCAGAAAGAGEAVEKAAEVNAGAAPQPRAARSVHLWYPAPEAVVFYNEVEGLQSQNGSYFMACGFSHGYFGIQQLDSAQEKVVLFSVWDSAKENNPNAVANEQRVTVLHQDAAVEVKRFGGEGTGAQSFFRYAWKPGERYRFALRAEAKGQRTAYSAFFYINEAKRWKHLATFETPAKGDALKGFYSFVEDFRRDGKSPGERRAARFGNGWTMAADGRWSALSQATFTADSTPLPNINATPDGNGFRLETGGATINTTPLRSRLNCNPIGLPLPPVAAAP